MEERKCVGWQEQETSRLFSAVQEARGSGAPLRQVFEDLSVDLGRKPNSIRNYYYACLRNQEQNTPRVQAFIPFTEAETHDLLRQVLTGCGQGMSVRACVTEMAGGDKSLMLRYQNKYRSTLRARPELIREVMEELESEGLPCADPYTARGAESAPGELLEQTRQRLSRTGDPALLKLLEGLNALLDLALAPPKADAAQAATPPYAGISDDAFNRALLERDRLSARNDLLRIALDDEQGKHETLCSACSTLVKTLRDFLSQSELMRAQQLGDFCHSLELELPMFEQEIGRTH